jgi:hypothetical protein
MRFFTTFLVALASLLSAAPLHAQPPAAPTATVPRVVRLSGVFQPANGYPAAPVEMVTFAIYADETGGLPLWQETQNVVIDRRGQYTVLLGATTPDGLPLEVFASAEARWLAMHVERPGENDPPRVRLTSVPYALRASDADTLGGKPASAYQLAEPGARERAGATKTAAGATSAGASGQSSAASALPLSAGTVNYVGKFVSSTDLGNSAIYDAGGFVGVNTTMPFDILHARFTNTNGGLTGYAVQNLGNTPTSYSGMLFYDQNGALGQFQGFNNVTHEYRINNIASGGSINFMLGSSSKFQVRPDGDVDIAGNIRKAGAPFLHSFGVQNTFLGMNAGNFTMTGSHNAATGTFALVNNTTGAGDTAIGTSALASNTSGSGNTASGAGALLGNTTGGANTASGFNALAFNTNGNNNTAGGAGALLSNITGGANTAIGAEALSSNTADGNVALGYQAGRNATTGPNNIYLGASATGSAGDANTIYLGVQGTQTKTVIAGIRGITTGLADAVPVVIDSAGQLGTVSSSRRFKEDIHDMGEASRAIFALRPVTFRYTQAYTDGAKPLQYGLVAEEVAAVFPALAVFNAEGGVDTVHYETLSVLLLNEVQKQQRALQEQRAEIELLKARLAAVVRGPTR